MENIRLITCTLNGKRVAYSSETPFYVQVGKGPKGSYKTVYETKGALGAAVTVFQSIRPKDGLKKRIYAPSMNRPLLVREK